MPIVVEQKSSFTPMSEGLHQAVFAEVRDLGEVETPFGKKRSIAARLVNAQGAEATRFYSPSLHEKSTLAKDLITLHGSKPTTFDIESLVGKQCQVLVTEKVNKKGQPAAKVEKILKPVAGQNVPVPKRAAAVPPTTATTTTATPSSDSLQITDDDLVGF
jgi:hypothetical protein